MTSTRDLCRLAETVKYFLMGVDMEYQLPQVDLTGCVTIVTGANTGIGKETARGLAERGAKVILACRDVERGEAAARDIAGDSIHVRVKKCDLASFASIREFCRQVNKEERRVDILVNNAGLVTPRRLVTDDGQELQLQTNHLGPFLLTNLLLDRLRASRRGARVINVSSIGHRAVMSFPWDDITMAKSPYIGFQVYAVTKLANIWFTTELARRLQGSGVSVFSVHPGAVSTDLGRNIGALVPEFVRGLVSRLSSLVTLSPEVGARTSLFCALESGLETGKYWDNCREGTLSSLAQDREQALQLWTLSSEIVQLEN